MIPTKVVPLRPTHFSSTPIAALDASLPQRLRERPTREALGLFYAEGVRFALRAFAARAPVVALVRCRALLESPAGERLVRLGKRARVPILDLDRDAFCAASVLGEPQGLGVVVAERRARLDAMPVRAPLFVGLDSIRAAGNLGTLLRSAAAAGANGVALLDEETDPFDPRAVRASMGAIFDLCLARASAAELGAWKRRTGARVVGATGDATRSFRDVGYRGPTVIMLGCERRGLSERQRALCDVFVRIPMHAGVDSLNVAAAAAVLLFEAERQRHAPARGPYNAERRE